MILQEDNPKSPFNQLASLRLAKSIHPDKENYSAAEEYWVRKCVCIYRTNIKSLLKALDTYNDKPISRLFNADEQTDILTHIFLHNKNIHKAITLADLFSKICFANYKGIYSNVKNISEDIMFISKTYISLETPKGVSKEDDRERLKKDILEYLYHA